MASKGNRATFAIKLTRDACTVENAQVKRVSVWAYMIEGMMGTHMVRL